jgi:hypothetical protein
MLQNIRSSKANFTFFLLAFLFNLSALGCSSSESNNKDSLTSGTHTGSGGSGLPPAAITVVAGNNELAASAGTTTITVVVTDNRGARTEATFQLTSSLGGNFVLNSGTKSGTTIGTTIGGIFITTFEAGGVLGTTEIAATIPGTTPLLRGSTTINLV